MTPEISMADAISNDARGMYAALADAGHDVTLYTLSGRSMTPWPTFTYWDALWKLGRPDDLLIYHYCTADANALSVMRQASCRLAIKYHNVTPSIYMAPYSTLFASMTKLGRTLLNEFADLPLDWLLGDSTYNLDELASVTNGQARYQRLPVFNQTSQLLFANDDPATLAYMGSFPINILTVGRLVPNKGYERMLEAFGRYLRGAVIRPHLHIIGSHDPRLSTFTDRLRTIIDRHAMADCVSLHPKVGTEALASFFRGSQFFWTASHHEGFCVPVTEAMAFGIPVLSSSDGALRETGGDAVLFADTQNEMVAALGRLTGDDELVAKLRRLGKRRYEPLFSNRVVTQEFLAFVEQWHAETRGTAVIDTPTINPRDYYWFGLPDAEAVVSEALDCRPALARGGLYARDRRLDLVHWALGDGRSRSELLAAYARSPVLAAYGDGLEMPPAAARLTTAEKLVWTFSRREQERYPMTKEGVAGFLRWLEREGNARFGLPPRTDEVVRDANDAVAGPASAAMRWLETSISATPPSHTPLAKPIISTPPAPSGMQVVDLDDFDQYIRSIGADINHGLLHNIQVRIKLDYDFETGDPFSSAYRNAVMAMYSQIANRSYDNGNECWHVDVESGVHTPYPFATHDGATIAAALQSLGFLMQVAAISPGERLVEFGVGWGNTTLAAAHAGAEVHAIDIEQSYLDIVDRRAALAGLTVHSRRCDFADVVDLPGSFDVALFYESFHHSPDPVGFLDKVIGKLTPGGRIVWGGEPIYEEFWAPWGVRLDGLSVYCIRERGWLELGLRPSFLRELLRQRGFDFVFHHLPTVLGPQGMAWTARRA